MANRYWVAGGSTHNWSDTSNWSTSSGGAGGASVPGVSDDAIFDTNSASYDCTVNTNIDVLSITYTSYAGTFEASTYTINVAGSVSASGSTAIISLSSSSWTVGGSFSMRFISASSTEGTSTLRMTNTTSGSWMWKTSGGNFYSITLGPNANITQNRNLVITGAFVLESGATWNCGTYSPEVRQNTTFTLGADSSITTTTGEFRLYVDGTGTRTGNATATIGRFATRNSNNGALTTIPIATYTGTFVLNQNAASYNGTWRFEGDTVIEGNVSTGMGKATNETIDTATNNASLTFKGNVNITPSQGTVSWSAGTGTITLDNTAAQAINFNGQTVEPVIVSDASTGAITLGADFTTPYVHDCGSLIDLNGFTITETGTDPSPCLYNYIFRTKRFRRLS